MSQPVTETATNGKSTAFYENGEQVYPCRCGQTHRGDYAAYDYGHHNCFHEAPLHRLAPEEGCESLICPECGVVFGVEP